MFRLIYIIFKSLYLYFIAIFLLEALPLPTKGFKAGDSSVYVEKNKVYQISE